MINIGHRLAGLRARQSRSCKHARTRIQQRPFAARRPRKCEQGIGYDRQPARRFRTAREFLHLAGLAELHSEARPLLALLDGQFVIWGIKETELSSAAKAAIFDDGVLLALDQLHGISNDGDVALASYISRPAGREVTNALRLAACPRLGGVNCRDCPRQDDTSRPCDAVAGGVDADLIPWVSRGRTTQCDLSPPRLVVRTSCTPTIATN